MEICQKIILWMCNLEIKSTLEYEYLRVSFGKIEADLNP